MNSALSKILLFKILLLTLLSQVTSACYDGWDERGGSGETQDPIPTDTDAIKPLYVVVFETIYLSTAATADSSCFGASGTQKFRTAEWATRISTATEALKKVADNVAVVPRSIATSDCTALAAVETAAADSDPGSVKSYPDDPLDRPIVHLKAVFWDTDVGGAFTLVVETPHWTAWRVLRTRGRPAVSLHYFSISNPTTGHFAHWKSANSATIVSTATPINTVDPTDAGTAARTSTATSDAATLASWTVTTANAVRP